MKRSTTSTQLKLGLIIAAVGITLMYFLQGCNKDEDPKKESNECLPVEIVGSFRDVNEPDANYDYKMVFKKENGVIVSAVWYVSEDGKTREENISYTYDNSGKLITINYGSEKRTLSYSGDRVMEIKEQKSTGKIYTLKYSYNSSGQVVKEELLDDKQNIFSVNSFEYNGSDNPSVQVRETGSRTEFEYDKNKSVFSIYRYLIEGTPKIFKNNITKATTKTNTGAISKTITYTYEVDSQGNSTKMTMVDGGETTVMNFKYDCQ
jgi:hypothetical protein